MYVYTHVTVYIKSKRIYTLLELSEVSKVSGYKVHYKNKLYFYISENLVFK